MTGTILLDVLGLAALGVAAWVVARHSSWATSQLELADTRAAVDRAAQLVFLDADGRIVSVNDRVCAETGFDAQELVGRTYPLCPDAQHFFPTVKAVIGEHQAWRGEVCHLHRDGRRGRVHTTIVPLDPGRPYAYVAIGAEVTASTGAATDDAAQHSAGLLRQMADLVGHEVRNPLAAIKGVLQVIGHRMPESSDRRVLGELVARVDVLEESLDDMLAFAHPRRLSPEFLGVRSLVAEGARSGAKSGRAEVGIVGDDAEARVDPRAVREVVAALVENAEDAGAQRIVARLARRGDAIEVTVEDDGPGIPTELRERVFEPFFTTGTRGTGLGLPMARRAVEAHGGALTLGTSSLGGAAVIASWPIAGPAERLAAAAK